MNALNRVNVFDEAYAACEKLKLKYPSDASIDSVLRQIEYLRELNSGARKDAIRLDDIIVDVLATREIAALDESVADMLADVMEEVVKMKRERNSGRFL